MKPILIFALSLLSSAVTLSPAIAQDRAVSIVATADLDLATDHGQRQLDRRIAHAARQVCGTASDADLEGQNQVRKCREQTIASAVAQRDQLLAAAERGAAVAVVAAR